MDAIARSLKDRPGMIVVRGHTDGHPYKSATYDNWRLSSARAQMAYYMLTRAGLPESRFERIEGYADRRLTDPQPSLRRRKPTHRNPAAGAQAMRAARLLRARRARRSATSAPRAPAAPAGAQTISALAADLQSAAGANRRRRQGGLRRPAGAHRTRSARRSRPPSRRSGNRSARPTPRRLSLERRPAARHRATAAERRRADERNRRSCAARSPISLGNEAEAQ